MSFHKGDKVRTKKQVTRAVMEVLKAAYIRVHTEGIVVSSSITDGEENILCQFGSRIIALPAEAVEGDTTSFDSFKKMFGLDGF